MKYWDSSAFVPLLISESSTARLQVILRKDRQIATWWATELECVSAIMRRQREQQITPSEAKQAFERLKDFATGWQEIEPAESVRQKARQLLATHPLRTADALQLAAALTAANQQPTTLEFVCLDDRLAEAARREGFPVLS